MIYKCTSSSRGYPSSTIARLSTNRLSIRVVPFRVYSDPASPSITSPSRSAYRYSGFWVGEPCLSLSLVLGSTFVRGSDNASLLQDLYSDCRSTRNGACERCSSLPLLVLLVLVGGESRRLPLRDLSSACTLLDSAVKSSSTPRSRSFRVCANKIS